MATPHVPVSSDLALPAQYAHVAGYLALVDPELRIRQSAEKPQVYILERRCRRRPAANLGMRDRSDMHIQARDGYIHVASVHPNYLNKPWNIIRALKEEGADLFVMSAQQVDDEDQYEKAWAKETRRRRRLGLYRDIARDAFPILDRMGNRDGTERMRISAPSGVTRLGGQVVAAGVN
jgi:hypothetical protein